jgi:hypothetical protein
MSAVVPMSGHRNPHVGDERHVDTVPAFLEFPSSSGLGSLVLGVLGGSP